MANGVGSAAGRSKRDQMPKQIRLNAFDMNCIGHQSTGLWTHPRDRSDRYNTLEYWVELARILERGKFDALFLADVLGVYDVYRGSPDAAIANAVQVPVNDPLLLIPAMAYVTRNLGFGVTCAVSYEHPYTLARRFSTLDHLTGGRIGLNLGPRYPHTPPQPTPPPPPPPGAPRPQRTRWISPAGPSWPGRQSGAPPAECVFIKGPRRRVIAPFAAVLRRGAAGGGRNPAEILIFTMMTVITAARSSTAE